MAIIYKILWLLESLNVNQEYNLNKKCWWLSGWVVINYFSSDNDFKQKYLFK